MNARYTIITPQSTAKSIEIVSLLIVNRLLSAKKFTAPPTYVARRHVASCRFGRRANCVIVEAITEARDATTNATFRDF